MSRDWNAVEHDRLSVPEAAWAEQTRAASPLSLPFCAAAASTGYDRLGTLPVVVLRDNVRTLYIVGAFFRTAVAVGTDRLLLSGITASPPHRRLAKTALGAEEQVRWEAVPDPIARVAGFREAGWPPRNRRGRGSSGQTQAILFWGNPVVVARANIRFATRPEHGSGRRPYAAQTGHTLRCPGGR